MSRATKSDEALIGYKIKIGDYVVMKPPFSSKLEKAYRVTDVTSKQAICKVRDGKRLKFPRYYHLPFLPIQSKPSTHTSPNKWIVRVNDTKIKRRLKL